MSKEKPNAVTISVAGKRKDYRLNDCLPHLSELFRCILGTNPFLLLHLQTGLADGADQSTMRILIEFAKLSNANIFTTGILPFAKADYLKTIKDQTLFETLSSQCNRLIVLDGKYLPDDLTNPTPAKTARNKAYRQLALFLIQSGDVLLAIADENDELKPGGTLETIRQSLSEDIPVIFWSLSKEAFFWLTNISEFEKISATEVTLKQSPNSIAESLFRYLC